MKKLIALMFCLTVMAVAARAEYPGAEGKSPQKARLNQAVARAASAAQQQAPQKQQPIKIAGEKRLVTVRLELQEMQDNEQYILHRYWYCPAVIFNKEGALAFDGECWKAFEEAEKIHPGPVAHFFVDLGNLGEYKMGEHYGEPFYFMSSYVAYGSGDEYTHSVDESFVRSADKTYIIYKRSLFNDPTNQENADNSEVKKAIANYYSQHNLKEVTAEHLSKYFRQKHAHTKQELTRFPF